MKRLLARVWRNRWLTAALGLCVLMAALTAFTFKLSWDITEVGRALSLRTAPPPEGARSERLQFGTDDGTKLAGLWIPAEQEKAAVILCHGRGSGKGWFLRHGQVAFLHENGYSCLTFDFQGTGESEGRYCTLGDFERQALRAAIRAARKRSDGPVALWGVSMGAATALLVSAEEPGIDLVIAESSYDSFVDTVAHHQWLNYRLPRWPMTGLACWLTERRTGCHVENVDMVAAAARRKGSALLLVHCEKDVRTPTTVARRIFEAACEPKEFFVILEAEHGQAFQKGGERYRQRLLSALSACPTRN
jgi:pimeloyl-ACP methyl ester carboxylesterase